MKLLPIFSFLVLSVSFYPSGTTKSWWQGGINHVAIYVVDLQRSGDFYINTLGADAYPNLLTAGTFG